MMSPILLSFVLVATILVVVNPVTSYDYCSLSRSNTRCLYPNPNSIGAACGSKLYGQGVTAADKTTILNQHNALRRRVAKGQETKGKPGPQPAAANMRELVWDDELAQMAQTWANQCIWGHDQNRVTPNFPSAVGQNIASGWGSSANAKDWTGMINMWYNEVSSFNKSLVSNYKFDSATGHYTQVVWAATAKIGCGFVNYYKAGQGYTSFYVCNYGPAGNYQGQPVYKIGAAASACPSGTSARDGLCA